MRKKLNELTILKIRAVAAERVAAELAFQAAQKTVTEARQAQAQVFAEAGLRPDQGVFMTPGPDYGTVVDSNGQPVEFPDPQDSQGRGASHASMDGQ